jgi:hypothetical protein
MVGPTAEDKVIIILVFVIPLLFLIAVFAYILRAKKRYRGALWSVRNTNVVFDGAASVAGLQIAFDGSPAGSLSVARVAIWNPGFNPLDLGKAGGCLHVEATAPDVRILEARTIQSNIDTTNLALRSGFDRQQIDLELPGLASSEGIVLQVVHTGVSGGDLQVTCDRLSISLKYRPPAALRLANSWRDRPVKPTAAYSLIGLAVVIWIVAFVTRFTWAGNPRLTHFFQQFWVVGAGITFIAEVAFQRSRSSSDGEPKVALPRELGSFFED